MQRVVLGLRVLVTGGRNYPDRGPVFRALDGLHRERGISVVVHGACKTGVDAFAKEWALARDVKHEPHPADWNRHGRRAGPIRNLEMVRTNPDICLSFPGGDGTANCTEKAREHGVSVVMIDG